MVRIPEPPDTRVVVFLDGSGMEGQPPKSGAAAVRVREVGWETEIIVNRVVMKQHPMQRSKPWPLRSLWPVPSQGRWHREPWGASPRLSARTVIDLAF